MGVEHRHGVEERLPTPTNWWSPVGRFRDSDPQINFELLVPPLELVAHACRTWGRPCGALPAGRRRQGRVRRPRRLRKAIDATSSTWTRGRSEAEGAEPRSTRTGTHVRPKTAKAQRKTAVSGAHRATCGRLARLRSGWPQTARLGRRRGAVHHQRAERAMLRRRFPSRRGR